MSGSPALAIMTGASTSRTRQSSAVAAAATMATRDPPRRRRQRRRGGSRASRPNRRLSHRKRAPAGVGRRGRCPLGRGPVGPRLTPVCPLRLAERLSRHRSAVRPHAPPCHPRRQRPSILGRLWWSHCTPARLGNRCCGCTRALSQRSAPFLISFGLGASVLSARSMTWRPMRPVRRVA